MTALATVETITSTRHHPNADRLDIVTVSGIDSIVPRDKYSPGDVVVFIAPDSCLPVNTGETTAWVDDYMDYTGANGRVRAIRLRGEWSEGMIVDPEHVSWLPLREWDVTDLLGVTKYEPPMPTDAKAKGLLPFGIPKTDEERWEHLERRGRMPWGEKVDVTEKIDGMSITVYYMLPQHAASLKEGGGYGVCSRGLELRLDGNNPWLTVAKEYRLEELLRVYCEEYNVSLALRGEVYGRGVQSGPWNPYSQRNTVDVAFFSAWNIVRRGYELRGDEHNYELVCGALDLPVVPMLHRDITLIPELVEGYANTEKMDSGDGIIDAFEGVVMNHDAGSFKVPNKYYDERKG